LRDWLEGVAKASGDDNSKQTKRRCEEFEGYGPNGGIKTKNKCWKTMRSLKKVSVENE